MNHELYIARRMTLSSERQQVSPSLTVALVGIVLAVVVMILSVAVVMGFKNEIAGKIMNLDAHLRVTNAALGIDDNYATVNGREVLEAINLDLVEFKGYAFQIEMKFTAHRMGFTIKEVPIVFVNRVLGTSKMSGGIFSEALTGVIKLRWSSIFNRKKYTRQERPQA